MNLLCRKLAYSWKRIAVDKPWQDSGYFSRRSIILLLIAAPAVAWVAAVLGAIWIFQ